MLDMGFVPEIRRLVGDFDLPSKGTVHLLHDSIQVVTKIDYNIHLLKCEK